MTPSDYMRLALALARRGEGRTAPNPPVGALLVRDGKIVGEGYHPAAGQPHAEIYALRQAGKLAHGADLYVTLEPCSHHGRTGPCAEAVIAAGVQRVFIGCGDPNPLVNGRGVALLQKAGITVETSLLEPECRRLLAPFVRHLQKKLPFVILKAATTLDGATATCSGESQWISGEASRHHVHELRDRVDAIMVGSGTMLRDNPRLTSRIEGGRDPLRVVIDSSLKTPLDAAMISQSSDAVTVIATAVSPDHPKVAPLRQQGVEILFSPAADGSVDLLRVMQELGKKNVMTLLLEGGATLNAAMLRAGLVQRAMIFVAPLLLGGAGKGIFAGEGVSRLAQALRLRDLRFQPFEGDLLIEGEVEGCLPV